MQLILIAALGFIGYKVLEAQRLKGNDPGPPPVCPGGMKAVQVSATSYPPQNGWMCEPV